MIRAAVVLVAVLGCEQVARRYFWVRPTAWPPRLQESPPPVDIVYAWSGEDHADLKDRRQRSGCELQFSLRSVWKHLPWVRRAHILVDTGKHLRMPSWVQSEGAGAWINMVDRCELFRDRRYCPTRNSNAVYAAVAAIPGLANLFLLMDDDVFFSHPIGPDFFFDQSLRPIVRTTRDVLPAYRVSATGSQPAPLVIFLLTGALSNPIPRRPASCSPTGWWRRASSGTCTTTAPRPLAST